VPQAGTERKAKGFDRIALIPVVSSLSGEPIELPQHGKKAVELRPDYSDALNNLGVLFVREKRYSEAEEKFKTCIRLAPNFDQAYLNLARLYVIQENKEKAREVLQELLRLQPQHKLAQQALEMLH